VTAGDSQSPRREEVFFRIHENIPREGPGDAESTRRAFHMLHLPDRPVADLRQHPEFKDDPIARQSIAATQEEIDLYRKYPDVYGYVFYVMRRR
jgi:hypothetical protein